MRLSLVLALTIGLAAAAASPGKPAPVRVLIVTGVDHPGSFRFYIFLAERESA